MTDKVYGVDFTNTTAPTGSMTISVHNGTALRDVLLSDLVKAIPSLRTISASAPTVDDDENAGDGYKRGDMWLDTSTGKVYMAWVVTAGAAGWLQISNNVQDDLDGISSTQGSILYRNATDWVALSPGTSGQFLKTLGAGANPAWGTAGAENKYIITPSITSNNLVFSLKYLDGNDPTSTNSIVIRVGNTEYTVTAATSFTKNAGTNWMNMGSAELAAKDVDLFVYAIGETGASAGIKFGYSRIPYAKTMSDFVNTTTDEKYIAGNWTNFNSTDPVMNIGRFRAQLSAGAGYTWSIPTARVVSHPIFETSILTYTPTLTGITVGNGANTGYYHISGKNVRVATRFTLGGTSSVDTAVSESLPVSCPNRGAYHPIGTMTIHDAGANVYLGLSVWSSATTFNPVVGTVSGSYVGWTLLASGAPITWVSGDEIACDVSYEFA